MSTMSARPAPFKRSESPVNAARDGTKLGPKPEAKILFQKFFKSVGPRTYAAQVKEAGNGNHFLVLTEGRRDEKTAEVRKTRLFIFSEDFDEFFGMFREAEKFIRANPISEEIKQRRQSFRAKQTS